MAQIVLTAAAGAAGKKFALNAFSQIALNSAANIAGSAIDNVVFSENETRLFGSRLDTLAVQSSTYGDMIPIIYGSSRIAGNIIWSQDIKEVVNVTEQSGGGKGGGGGGVTTEEYTYFATLAIAICEGEIDDVVRVWADTNVIDITQGEYRLYKGSETQQPDSLIESIEGVGTSPAYRGLAYVVIEDFPLAEYGNRIPNFSFEVLKKTRLPDNQDVVEDKISAMVMIPGSGEFVYDTIVQTKQQGEQIGSNWAQQGEATTINQNNRASKADSLVALDQLESTCPNVNWISVVIGWFADSLDLSICSIRPGVEFNNINTTPDNWQVGSYNRNSAYQITLDSEGNPVYGGTINDASLLRYLDELKLRGYNIMLYPLFFMDTPNKPWRGRLTGLPSQVNNFFVKSDGYNAYINHYANLTKDKIDAFIIGSELIGLTSIRDASNNFPAIDELVALAANVKSIVGSEVLVSYAADWSEYHHTVGGWYNLDPLWASSNIDFIGIDAYFPLTDTVQDITYDQSLIQAGWESGEGYDYIYSDPERTIRDYSLQPQYAWKNIAYWWNNTHINPDSNVTSWVPQSKKIWFTEYGFPSIDATTNQPNVFYDPNSSESAFPYLSTGTIDFQAQRSAISATEDYWQGSNMVEHLFLWTWDARPYPFWPQLQDIWSDYQLWEPGHWVQGKLVISGLAAIIADLCERAGLSSDEYNVSNISDLIDGFVISDQQDSGNLINILRQAYFFDITETDAVLNFIPRLTSQIAANISEGELIPREQNSDNRVKFIINRLNERKLAQKTDVNYIDILKDFQTGNQHAQRLVSNARNQATYNLPIVMSEGRAKNIADILLYNNWLERSTYQFSLPMRYLYLDAGDVINVTNNNVTYEMVISDINMVNGGKLDVNAIARDKNIYINNVVQTTEITNNSNLIVEKIAKTQLEFIDIPSLPTDGAIDQGILRFAACGLSANWRGAVLYESTDNGASYVVSKNMTRAAIMGVTTDILAAGVTNIFDNENKVTVILKAGSLSSATELAVLNGANAAIIGNEIIQFKTANLLAEYKYELSGLLRGRFNTEEYINSHIAGERFILLDSNIIEVNPALSNRNINKYYKAVTVGNTLGNSDAVQYNWQANNLKPYSPVHVEKVKETNGDWTISWLRRSRINGQWQDNIDTPIDESQESYEIDILANGNAIRTISIQNYQQVTYTNSQQITDFGSSQTNIDCNIHQLSELVGRGRGNI